MDVTSEQIEVANKIATIKGALQVISLVLRRQVKLKSMKLLKYATSPRIVSEKQNDYKLHFQVHEKNLNNRLELCLTKGGKTLSSS